MKKIVLSAAVLAAMAILIGVNDAQEKAKYTNKEVMAKLMKAPKGETTIFAKVSSGKGTDEEKALVVDYFTALHANTPQKGDAAAWKTRTEAILVAAKSGDPKALTAAANCKSCHELFRGK